MIFGNKQNSFPKKKKDCFTPICVAMVSEHTSAKSLATTPK